MRNMSRSDAVGEGNNQNPHGDDMIERGQRVAASLNGQMSLKIFPCVTWAWKLPIGSLEANKAAAPRL